MKKPAGDPSSRTAHSLTGKWRSSDEDSFAVYTVEDSNSELSVWGIYIYNGERFEGTEVRAQSDCVVFTSPSDEGINNELHDGV